MRERNVMTRAQRRRALGSEAGFALGLYSCEALNLALSNRKLTGTTAWKGPR